MKGNTNATWVAQAVEVKDCLNCGLLTHPSHNRPSRNADISWELNNWTSTRDGAIRTVQKWPNNLHLAYLNFQEGHYFNLKTACSWGFVFFWWCGRPLVSVYVLLPLNTLNNFKMCLSTLWIHANRLLALDHHYTIHVNLSFYAIFMRRDWFRWSKIMFSFSKTELFNALAFCPSYCESILVP